MKRTKKLLAITLLLSLLSSFFLTGCSVSISIEDSENMVKDFCDALKNDDFETASNLMHENANLDAKKIESAVADIENACGFDFSDGVEFIKRTNYYVMNNIGIPAGISKTITIKYDISVSEKNCELTVVLLNSSSGFGINTFHVSLPSSLGTNAA